MIARMPFIGPIIQFVCEVSMAIPFWIAWDLCSIGERFAPFAPKVYHHPGFWNIVGIFISVGILKAVFIPRLVSSSSSSEIKGGAP